MNRFDFKSLKKAIEKRDAKRLTSMYADGAVIRVVDKVSTPSAPNELSGLEDIANFLGDICSRDMTHEVRNEVIGEDRVAFTEACRYPDGTRVLSANVLELADGEITGHLMVQAWDE